MTIAALVVFFASIAGAVENPVPVHVSLPRAAGAPKASAPIAGEAANPASGCGKKFKNALVIAGGGVSPGTALGILAGARAAGKKPDVVITTCGASIGGAINNAFPDPEQAKAFVTSREFHKYLLNIVKVGQTSPVRLGAKLGLAATTDGRVPDVFQNNVMEIPESVPRLLPRQDYTVTPGETRLVTVAARSYFHASDALVPDRGLALYQQTYFTDPDTAKALKGLPASMKQNFPDSRINPETTVKTGVSTIQAARASISDPYLINPAKVDGEYYFAGAMDLFPVETARAIACNVTSTSPSSGYSKLEDLAVEKGFGFSQNARVAQLAKNKEVHWIQMKGAAEFAMDPDIDGMDFVNKIPKDYNAFKALIEKEYEFGYQRAFAAYSGGGSTNAAPVPAARAGHVSP